MSSVFQANKERVLEAAAHADLARLHREKAIAEDHATNPNPNPNPNPKRH